METDARNLLAMEKSHIDKVVRMCNYYKSFNGYLRHIPRTKNTVADYFTHLCDTDKCKIDELDMTLAHMYNAYWEEHDGREALFAKPEGRLSTYLSCHGTSMFSIVDDNETIALYSEFTTDENLQHSVSTSTEALATVDKLIAECHGGSQFHHSVRRMWLRLNERIVSPI